MEDKLITFETAKLAKEKGFDCDCNYYYESSEYLVHQYKGDNWNNYKLQSAPTQSLLQKWLREKFIDVLVDKELPRKYTFKVMITSCKLLDIKEVEYDTYEKALEKGLKEALKLIS